VRVCHCHDLRPVMAEQTGFYYPSCRVCHPDAEQHAGRRSVSAMIGAPYHIE